MLCGALTLVAAQVLFALLYPPEVPAKGEVARRTYRAAVDAVFDLHDTHRAEARQARRSYLPIYDRIPGVLAAHREKLVAAVLAQPLRHWPWPAPRSGGQAPPPTPPDAGFMGPRLPRVSSAPASSPASRASSQPASAPARPSSRPARRGRLPWQVRAQRRTDVQKLAYGCVKLLEPLYHAGVVADRAFPNEKRFIRRRDRGQQLYRLTTKRLYRFSQLRAHLVRATPEFFYHVPAAVRSRVIDFILQRLPPNMRYADDNRLFGDISMVTGLKVIAIRRGEILVRRGEVVGIRGHHAIRAAVEAGRESSLTGRILGRGVLLAAVLLLFCGVLVRSSPTGVRASRALAVAVIGLLALTAGGTWLLEIWPLHPMILPQGALALVIAVVLGRGPALVAALVVAAGLAISLHFDPQLLFAGFAGGVTAALTVRQRRERAVLAAGILVGLAQALALEASRAASGAPQSAAALSAAAQAFAGGVLASLLAALVLPFVQRWLGVASRGQLKAWGDLEHPLAARLRERAPQVFTHTLRVVALAERAAKAVGADRLLCRAGALYHDIGKVDAGDDEGPLEDPQEAALQRRRHVEAGLRQALEHHLPRELAAMIAEHHGTLEMASLLVLSRQAPSPEQRRQLRFAGPRPQSLEAAIVMIANRVEHARARSAVGVSSSLDAAAMGRLVDRVLVELLTQFQFAECRLTQRQLQRIAGALTAYLADAHEGA